VGEGGGEGEHGHPAPRRVQGSPELHVVQGTNHASLPVGRGQVF